MFPELSSPKQEKKWKRFFLSQNVYSETKIHTLFPYLWLFFFYEPIRNNNSFTSLIDPTISIQKVGIFIWKKLKKRTREPNVSYAPWPTERIFPTYIFSLITTKCKKESTPQGDKISAVRFALFAESCLNSFPFSWTQPFFTKLQPVLVSPLPCPSVTVTFCLRNVKKTVIEKLKEAVLSFTHKR